MQRETTIVLINNEKVESWGGLKEACKKHGWSYSTLSKKKLPIVYEEWRIHRCPFRQLWNQKR